VFPRSLLYPPPMIVRRTSFIAPCQPSKAARPPSGPLWVHEIKHDGYRLMVRRDGLRVRCFTRNGYDWADRFPAIVDAEPPRDCRRLQLLRRWSHDKQDDEQILT